MMTSMGRGCIVVLLAGCTAAHTPASDAAAFLEALDHALCDREVRCAGAFDTPVGPNYFVAPPYCHPSVHDDAFDGAIDAVARGQASFDADAAAACLMSLATMPCRSSATTTALPAMCSHAFHATAPLGASCDPAVLFDPCASGTYCAGTTACNGTCVPDAPDGSSCNTRPCARGDCGRAFDVTHCGQYPSVGQPCVEYCNSPTMAFVVCTAGTCVNGPLGAAGDPCGPTIGSCGAGLMCDWPEMPSTTAGACRAAGSQPLGAPCEIGSVCATGLDCIDRRRGVWPGMTPVGGACQTDRDCVRESNGCVRGRCGDLTLTRCTVDVPDVEGASREQCPTGQRCARADGFCFVALEIGDACDLTTQCADGSRCASGRCVAAVGPGAACTADALCPDGFACTSGACVALPAFGQACVDRCLNADCVAGRCTRRADGSACDDDRGQYFALFGWDHSICDGACDLQTHLCTPRLPAGSSCNGDWLCARGLTCLGGLDDHGVCTAATCP
jgi:hypothetical protein